MTWRRRGGGEECVMVVVVVVDVMMAPCYLGGADENVRSNLWGELIEARFFLSRFIIIEL